MLLITLLLLPTFMRPLPAIMPFYEVNKREQREATTWQHDIKGMDIETVNKYWNHRIKYEIKDKEWAAPEEVYLQGAGDCKDYAVAKYYSLRHLGYDTNRLRFTVVLIEGHELHAVLVVDNKVLDSRTDDIKTLDEIDYYEPAYSVNEDNLWTLSNIK